MDRFSSLPNEIIFHIGSFLSAKEAVFIMVLSKRWRNLFTIIPKLHFDGSVDNGKSFNDFVEGVLALPVSSRVKSFSLKWGSKDWGYDERSSEDIDPDQYDQANRCLCHVRINGKEGYSLPFEVFTGKTVVKLKLGSGFAINILPKDVFLPALKTLFLDSVRFFYDYGRCAFATFFSASPVLEELIIDGVEWERWKWSRILSSPTLQRLTIRRKEWYLYDNDSDYESMDHRGLSYNNESVSLDTPGLTYLDYVDYVPKKYPIVNLNSLVKAKLHLCVDEYCLWNDNHVADFDPMNLINGLKKRLRLWT